MRRRRRRRNEGGILRFRSVEKQQNRGSRDIEDTLCARGQEERVVANRLLASHHLVNSSTRGPCECCASVRPFVRYRRDTIFSFSLLLRALCSPRRACAPFFTSPSSSSRRWRVEREKERERFDSFPLFFSFFPLLRSMRRDRDILIVGKYYENRIKIEFEKEDGAREAKFYTRDCQITSTTVSTV